VRVRFHDFLLDTERRELSRGGERVPLRPKAMQLLETLVEQRPRAMSQEELYDRLWPDTFVDKTSLHKVMYQLRQSLGDDDQAIIRTVYGFGFSFAATVIDEEPGAPSTRCQIVIGESEFDLREGENLVGREREAAVRIEAPSISRRHARIVISGEQVTLEDLNSKNGTFVRGKRVHRGELSDGDAILFGTVAAAFRIVREEGSTETVL
jgi:DNA-binding winged helix-turn-helix (wHTH) protein